MLNCLIVQLLKNINMPEEAKKETGNIDPIPPSSLETEIAARKKKVRNLMIINAGIFALSLVLLVFFYYLISRPKDNLVQMLTKPVPADETAEGQESTIEREERKIDGVMVPKGEGTAYLAAVMLDNHPDARPHSGLAKAHLVFEAEVEGGVTRIMGIFSSGQALPEIGPVRSARPYFIDWARELSALYVHVGGSPDALVKIQQDKIQDMNEFFNGKYFWRGKQKSAPHNVYTSTGNLEKYLAAKEADHNRIVPWNFKEDLKLEARATSSNIHIAYRIKGEDVAWRYDRQSNYYIRSVGGEEYKDASGEAVMAKNVMIMVAEAQELDEKLRLDMETIGKGPAKICMDGFCVDGYWEKKHPADRTRFYYEDSREASFNRGTTWVQVLRPDIQLAITN